MRTRCMNGLFLMIAMLWMRSMLMDSRGADVASCSIFIMTRSEGKYRLQA